MTAAGRYGAALAFGLVVVTGAPWLSWGSVSSTHVGSIHQDGWTATAASRSPVTDTATFLKSQREEAMSRLDETIRKAKRQRFEVVEGGAG